jgi:hypothetical protein
MLTVRHTPLYILCYNRHLLGGGIIDGQAYSHLGDAEFALAAHRRNHPGGFATDEDLQSAADEAVEREWDTYIDFGMMECGTVRYGTPRGDRGRYEKTLAAFRRIWIIENSWTKSNQVTPSHRVRPRSSLPPHIEEVWYFSDYTCWVREIAVVPQSEQSKLRESFARTRENKVSSADVTRAYEPNT